MNQASFWGRSFHPATLTTFLFLLTGLGSLQGQIERWRTLGLEDGLPQVQIYDMVQDPGGWIWVGTHGGVSRFDGSDFHDFTQREGLEDNHVSCILPLGPNEVFLGHTYSSAFTYLKKDSVHPVSGVPEAYEGRANDLIKKGGRIIVASSDGILLFEQQKDSIRFSARLDTNDGLGSMGVRRLFDPGNGQVWAIHQEGVARIDPIAGKEKMLSKKLPIRGGSPPVQYRKDGDQGLHVLKQDSLLHYSEASSYPEEDPSSTHSLPEGFEPTAFAIKEEEFWIGSSENGILRILPERKIRYGKAEGLPNEQITTLLQSDAGNIWMGTDQGIAHSTDLAFQFINKKNGLKNPIVWAIQRGIGNDLWVGTEGGLTQIRFETSKLLDIKGVDHIGKEKGVEMIDALHLDQQGRLWVTNRGDRSELLVLDAENRQILHRWPLAEEASYVAIERRSNGNILIGGGPNTIFEAKVDPKTGRITPPDTFESKEGDVPTDLWDMFRGPSGKTWLATNGKGGGYLENGKYHSLGGEEKSPHPRPLSITKDKNGHIWFGTIGAGVIRYTGNGLDSITIEDGLTVNTPFFVQADGKGHVWVGTSNGVDRIRIKDLKVTTFGREQGLVGMETNQNARECMEDGTLWFGTIKGLVRCTPSRISLDRKPPRLHLQELKVASKAIPLQKGGHILNYHQNHLRFEFIGVHPDDPGQIAYRYRLKGLPGSQWSEKTEKQSVTFDHLPAGVYELQIKARNSDGVWNQEPLSYSFTIEPPFWRTTWFYSSSGVLTVFLVLFILRARTRSLLKQQKRLEEKVAARTQELEKEKERIERINQDLEEQKSVAEHQKELVESKNKEITDSLRYAKRIQKALLKEEKRVSEHLPPHFVLFKPREHVSGDFYWALEKEGKLFVTVADCTGHGVPGAFMSMLGTAFLNEICAPEGVKGPAAILHQLRQKVVKELAQDSEDENLKDGMDISMLRVDLNTREVAWAGANNPLVRIRPMQGNEVTNGLCSKDGQRSLIEYQADHKPIGLSDDDTPFHEHCFTPEEGEKLYLFSDGFPDQFGGERGKKYKSKNFKQLLLEVSAEPMDDQLDALDEEFERWRGDQEQIDDVCVLGIAP